MSDRLAVFNAGRIEQVGTPAEVYERPANEFVAGFVGVSNVVERDGRRFTIRPEKIRLLGERAGRRRACTRRRAPSRRGLRGDGHALPRRARRRRRAAGRAPEPGDLVAGAPRAARAAGAASPGATSRRSRSTKCSPARRRQTMIKRGTWAAALACAALFAAAGCGGSDSSSGGGGRRHQADAGFKVPKVPMAQSVGAGEGKLNIIAWAGYAEDGSTDPKVDWVTPFEKQTGCQVNVKIGNTSDEMVTLMSTGQYDGVSASGDATLRLIAGGDVAPVNTDLVPNYADVFAELKDQDFNSVNGQMYGIPHGRGANLLMWRSDEVTRRSTRGARSSTRLAVQGQGHRLRQPDLHRRRGAVPEEDQARAEDHQPLRARRRPVPGGGRPAQGPAPEHRRVLVGLHQGAGGLHERRLHRGTTWQVTPTCSTATRSRSRRSCPRRARPAGRTRG